jgi:hypothetical protein
MQRGDFPLSLHRHPARQLLAHVVTLLNRRAGRERTTRFIKVRAHRGEPLNELADSLAAAVAVGFSTLYSSGSGPGGMKETWVEWDARVREDLVQQAAEQYVTLLEWRTIFFVLSVVVQRGK